MNREELLRSARNLYENPGTNEALKVVLEETYPELKESEDERIRKAIEDTIRVYGKTQGEWLCGYDMDTLVVHLREAFGALEKQKEQKPAEKISVSEELYEHIRNACACIDNAMSSDTLCDMTDYLEMADSSAQKAFDMVEKSVINQPAEWSEKHIADIFEKVGLAKIVREQGNDDLTNALQDAMLELSKSGNAEWSEEDKEKLDFVISVCIDAQRPSGCVEGSVYYNKLTEAQKWLKSLRPKPRWKPSEEQMKALKLAYEDAFEFPESGVPHLPLESLLSDLQKRL